jgi:hypothetical protein
VPGQATKNSIVSDWARVTGNPSLNVAKVTWQSQLHQTPRGARSSLGYYSAGKDKGGRTTRGNRWLRATLTQCAWAASAKKDCHLKRKFWRLASERKKRAVVAVAHTLLVLIYQVLTRGEPHEERGKTDVEERQNDGSFGTMYVVSVGSGQCGVQPSARPSYGLPERGYPLTATLS